MHALLGRARGFYGANPFHLLVLVAAFALTGYTIFVFTPQTLVNPDIWWQSIAVWFLGAFIAHDLVLFPIYALADRSLGAGLDAVRYRRIGSAAPRVPAVNFVRLPILATGLTLLVFFPGIISQGKETYLNATGLTQEPYLTRWLLLVGVFFAVSALAYAVRLALPRSRTTVVATPPVARPTVGRRPTLSAGPARAPARSTAERAAVGGAAVGMLAVVIALATRLRLRQ